MLKLDEIRENNEDKLFELWTKELERELPNFWAEVLEG
jgi:hypothetical protein